MRYILSIRGGGIRGIIPCCCLVKLEEQLHGLTRDHVHLCAGTSSGALIAAGVAAGVPAGELLGLFTGCAQKIFASAASADDAKRVARDFLFEPDNLRDVLVKALGPAAAWTLNDCPVRVMFSATGGNGHQWFFTKDNERNSRTTGGLKLVDAAVTSACMPAWGTANPAYQACVEAFEYDDFTPRGSRVISLGTGFFPASSDIPAVPMMAPPRAARSLMDSSEDWLDDAVERQWPGLMQNFNPQLPRAIEMADLDAIPELVAVGREMAAEMDWIQILK